MNTSLQNGPDGSAGLSGTGEAQLGSLSLDLLGTLLDHLPSAPFFLKDSQLRYVRANRAMAELCGADGPGALLGRTARDFFPAEQWRHFEALDRKVLETGQPLRDQFVRAMSSRGPKFWLLFARWPIFEGEKVVGVAAIARNLTAPDRSSESLTRIAPALERLRRNWSAPVDVVTLAETAGVSVSQLDRDFSGLLGMSPTQYQKRIRHERACELLRTTSDSIAAVAQSCGYSDQGAFTRAFRNHLGLTPSAYRRAAQNGTSYSRK